jgi:hypothetical protein
LTSDDWGSGFGLPSPETLERLEKLAPGFTKFLQKELIAHREAQERSEAEAVRARMYRLETERILATRGQLFGLAIGVFAIAAGTIAAVSHAQIAGTFIGAGGVVGLVTVFVVKSRLDEQAQARGTAPKPLKPKPVG